MPETEEGQELPYAGTPEMDALFQQINQNPQMLQVVGQNPELLAEVMKHAGLDTNAQELIDMTAEWPDEAAEDSMQTASLPPNEEATADVPVDEGEEVEEAEPMSEGSEPVEAPDESAPNTMEASAMPQRPMPPNAQAQGQMPSSAGSIDDLISAEMMGRAVGNPNAPVPTGMQAGRQQRPAIPQSRQGGGGNPQQQMIADIFRKQGAGSKKSKSKRANA